MEKRKNALNYVSFHISEGEQVGLIGANGAGKSTLMKAMLGLIPAKGKITVDEIEVNQENSSRIWQCLRYVFQDSDNQMFMPTVYEDMIFGPLNYGKSRKEADQLAREALEELDLIHLKDRQNYKMSGGEKRMAAIATILAMNPKVMLMDEPSTALDPKEPETADTDPAEASDNKRSLQPMIWSLKMTAADADIYICFCQKSKKQVAE